MNLKKIKLPYLIIILTLTSLFTGITIGVNTLSDEDIDVVTPVVSIIKPRDGFLYLCNRELTYIGLTTIIGLHQGIEVWADVNSMDRENVSHVEFYLNGNIAGIGNWDMFRQYYTWKCTKLGIGIWVLTAQAILKETQNIIDSGTSITFSANDGLTMFYCNFRILSPRK